MGWAELGVRRSGRIRGRIVEYIFDILEFGV
jgi:hypothetical protein